MTLSTSEVQTEEANEVQIWQCTDSECNAWTREEFVKEASPACPICSSAMERSNRLIPQIVKKGRKTFIMGKRRF